MGYVGCNRELPAETTDNTMPSNVALMYWGRNPNGNFLRFQTDAGTTSYFGEYNEEHYIVNPSTYGLIIKDIDIADAGTYTRSETGSTDLNIAFTVMSKYDLLKILC